jgi:predicted metal-dependent hydrolase
MDVRFAKGIRLFNTQSFFEAHDVWEELWREAAGEERLFYQGLIQTAVGLYHLMNRNYRGAGSQLGKAIAKLERYIPVHQGLETLRLAEQLRVCSGEAKLLQQGFHHELDHGTIPRITVQGYEDRLNEQTREGH